MSAVLETRASHPLRILELGSGPGQLAAAVLRDCNVSQYVALDFSSAMHDLAREQLGPLAANVKFVKRDFRNANWNTYLGKFDAALTLQAAHETRHRDRLPGLLRRTRACLKTGGLLLYCDHYRGTRKNPALYLQRHEHPQILRAAGFVHVDRLLDKGGMALYSARAGAP